MIFEPSYTEEFYKKLAYLFYSIAMADKKMVVDEKRKIVAYVEKYWMVSLESTNSAEIIYETLRVLIKEKVSSEEAFQIFKTYFNENPQKFPLEINKKLMETIDSIAISASRRNKSELVLLTKTHKLLFKDP
ncbi:hypothetical protein [Flagellimonas flava]|uniref:hypothetical protein n=1 Tax=Flagellimonas flava TaxID=570519 RepID=UPI003D646339